MILKIEVETPISEGSFPILIKARNTKYNNSIINSASVIAKISTTCIYNFIEFFILIINFHFK